MSVELQFRASNTNSPKIDQENRIIYDVIMAEVGEAKGWGIYVEQEFIDSCVAYALRFHKDGLPCEFGHNYEGMGRQLGKFLNVRKEGAKMIGDLQVYEAADISPTLPQMGEWLLKIANEGVTSVNASIKFRDAGYYQRDASGSKVKVWYYGDDGWVKSLKEYGKVYVEFKELRGCDIVSKGALTNKLFDSSTLYQQFQDIINEPDFRQVLELHHQDMPQLTEFFSQKLDTSLLGKVKKFIAGDSKNNLPNQKVETMSTETTVTAAADAVQFSAAEQAIMDGITALSTRVEQLEAKPPAIEDTAAADAVQFSASEQAILDSVKALSTRVDKIAGLPAADEIAGATETTQFSSSKKSWEQLSEKAAKA